MGTLQLHGKLQKQQVVSKKMQRHFCSRIQRSASRHLATEKQAGLKNNLVPTKKHLVSLSFCCRRVRGMREASSGMNSGNQPCERPWRLSRASLAALFDTFW